MSHPWNRKIARRQQAFLDLRCQLKVVFQGALLFGRQAVQTDAGQRILAQPLVFHRAQAYLAYAKRTVIDAFERAVHLLQQADHVVTVALSQNFRQPGASRQQLVPDAGNVGRISDRHS